MAGIPLRLSSYQRGLFLIPKQNYEKGIEHEKRHFAMHRLAGVSADRRPCGREQALLRHSDARRQLQRPICGATGQRHNKAQPENLRRTIHHPDLPTEGRTHQVQLQGAATGVPAE